jgi:hypothetical protein
MLNAAANERQTTHLKGWCQKTSAVLIEEIVQLLKCSLLL